jgi:hypothetical protein
MNKEALEAEKAEFIQSVNALMIPLGSFLACVIMAAGVFLVYHGESVGWIFCGVSALIVVAAFVGLVRFQNKYRARGVIKDAADEEAPIIFDPEIVKDRSARTPVGAAAAGSAQRTDAVVIPEPFALR